MPETFTSIRAKMHAEMPPAFRWLSAEGILLAYEWADASPGGWRAEMASEGDPELGHEMLGIIAPGSTDGAWTYFITPAAVGSNYDLYAWDQGPGPLATRSTIEDHLQVLCPMPAEFWRTSAELAAQMLAEYLRHDGAEDGAD